MILSSVLLGWTFPAGLTAGALLLRSWSRARSISNAIAAPALLLLFRKAALYIPVVGTVSTEDQVLFWSLGAWIFFGLFLIAAIIICSAVIATTSEPSGKSLSSLFDDDFSEALPGIVMVLLILSIVLLPIDGWMHIAVLPLTPLALLKIIFITPALPWLAFAMLVAAPLLLIGFRNAVPGFQMGMCVLICLAGLLQMGMQAGHWREMQRRLDIKETWFDDNKETNDFYGDWLLQLPRSVHCGITSIETSATATAADECAVREQIAGVEQPEAVTKVSLETNKVAAFGIIFLFLIAVAERLRHRSAPIRPSEWGRAKVAVGVSRWAERPVPKVSFDSWQPEWIWGAVAPGVLPAAVAIAMHNLWMSAITCGVVAALLVLSMFVLSDNKERKLMAGVAAALAGILGIAYIWPTVSFAAAFGLTGFCFWMVLIAFLYVRSAGARAQMARYALLGRDYRGGRGRQVRSSLKAIDNFQEILPDLPDHTLPLAPPERYHPKPADIDNWRILALLDCACSGEDKKVRGHALELLPHDIWPDAIKNLMKSGYDESRAHAATLENISRTQLLKLCDDTIASVRARAAARLGKSLHPGEASKLSRSRHSDMRIHAIESGLQRKRLIKLILRDKEPQVRQAALAAIARNVRSAEASRLAASRHVDVRSFAIQSGKLNLSTLHELRAFDKEQSVRALAWARSRDHVTQYESLELITSKYPDVRIEAINSRRPGRPAVFQLACEDAEAQVREVARRQITDITKQEAEAQAGSPYADARSWAVRSGLLSSSVLNERIETESDHGIRQEILGQLLVNVDENTAESTLASGDYERRSMVVQHAPLNRKRLKELAISDGQGAVRQRALERLNPELSQEEALELFTSTNAPADVRNFAIQSGRLSAKRELLVEACCSDHDSAVRLSVWILIQSGLTRDEAVILAGSSFAEIRLLSARSGLLPEEVLNQLNWDTSSAVRQAVQQALSAKCGSS